MRKPCVSSELPRGRTECMDLLCEHAFIEAAVGEGLALQELVKVVADPVQHTSDF